MNNWGLTKQPLLLAQLNQKQNIYPDPNNNVSVLNCFNQDLKFYNIYWVAVKGQLKEWLV